MKVRIWKVIFKGMVLLSLIFLAGCGTLEKLVSKDDSQAAFGNFIGNNEGASQQAAEVKATAEIRTITLYFADASGNYLMEEQRTAPKTESLARETVIQWLKGPAGNDNTLLASVPVTTQLLDISLKEGVATVDLSNEFLQPNPSVSQEVALYGLVNTLTQYSTINQVKIWIEGKTLSKYGSIDATTLVNKDGLVKEGSFTTQLNPTPNTGSGVTGPGNTGSGVLPSSSNSPSSINLFDINSSST